MISSVSYDQQEILNHIIKLHNKGNTFNLDCTYSTGSFYKDKRAPEPIYKSDIFPLNEEVIKADSRELPFENLDSIMFDPPFLATKGPSLTKVNDSNIIAKRFSVFPDEISLHQYYIDSLKEFYRVLTDNGLLVFKCQDKVSSGTQYMSHNFIINEAERLGFYCVDLFILLAKNRIIASWQRNQKHARKFHSYFLVFRKCKKKVCYVK